MIKYKKKYIYRERGIFMSFTLGNPIAVSTNFIKSNPAVPVYKGTEEPENLFGVIYHIEIGYNLDNEEVENFLEKVFNNMKVIRGLISEKL